MNLDIIFSIISASCLFVILRFFSYFKVDNFHGIVINYFVAAGCAFAHHFNNNIEHVSEVYGFIHISFFIGLLFIFVFNLTAKVAQFSGVGIASVASKLSMVIPITVGIFLYNEGMTGLKIAGLVLALIAVYLVSLQERKKNKPKTKTYFLPMLLFIGCGLVDTSIKYVQNFYFSDHNRQIFIMSLFACAGIIGLIKLIYDMILQKKHVTINSISGGLILGICNYLSLLFLIRSFEFPGAESSKVFAMVNLGVVILSAVWGLLIFKEKLNRYKVSGILTAVAAILLLFFA